MNINPAMFYGRVADQHESPSLTQSTTRGLTGGASSRLKEEVEHVKAQTEMLQAHMREGARYWEEKMDKWVQGKLRNADAELTKSNNTQTIGEQGTEGTSQAGEKAGDNFRGSLGYALRRFSPFDADEVAEATRNTDEEIQRTTGGHVGAAEEEVAVQ